LVCAPHAIANPDHGFDPDVIGDVRRVVSEAAEALDQLPLGLAETTALGSSMWSCNQLSFVDIDSEPFLDAKFLTGREEGIDVG
jgi:hypothetical protein